MKIAYIQHISYEVLGVIASWVQDNQHEITAYRPFAGDALPALDSFDFLIILGGPQSALDVEHIDYLHQEMVLIQQAIAANKYVLGICLGAQLIGVALGGEAKRSPYPEIGCFAVELLEAAQNDPIMKTFPLSFESLHWHFDMIGLPDGAEVLAQSAGCPRQVVRFQQKVYGIQCHLEFNKQRTQVLVDCAYDDIEPGKFVQNKNKITSADFAAINQLMRQFLDHFVLC